MKKIVYSSVSTPPIGAAAPVCFSQTRTIADSGIRRKKNKTDNGTTNFNYTSFSDLPQTIQTSQGSFRYRYDTRQQRTVKDLSTSNKEFYIGEVILDQTGAVKSYQTSDGYAIPNTTSGNISYFYYVKDWLGTTRVIIDNNGAVINATDHYPYGKRMPGRELVVDQEGNRYQFTGHENDGENSYEYHGARFYNEEIARYMNVDPMAEAAPGWSPYRYGFDNPVMFVDPTGMFETRKEARQYKKEHDIEGRIRKDSDGEGFNISNKYTGESWSKGTQWEINNNFADKDGIVKSTMVVGEKSQNTSMSSDDQFKIGFSTVGLVNDIGAYSWNNLSNKKQWEISYDVGKHLKSSGYNTKTSALKNGTSKLLKQSGKYLGAAGGLITVGEVVYNGNVKASNVLDATMTGVAFIPVVGWIASGVYFGADIITQGVTGKSIGGHLDGTIDNSYGTKNGVLVDF